MDTHGISDTPQYVQALRDVQLVRLYHQEDGLEDVLAEGTVMILKKPFLRLMPDDHYGLRADHPSDVVFLSEDDERIPGSWRGASPEQSGAALAWKTKGNNHFGKSAYRPAIEWYDHLFCEKAFAHAFADMEGLSFDLITTVMDLENGGTMGA